MSTKALKTQLLAAVAMVLVASVALGSSTYAWFASNKTVTADGMKVQAQSEGGIEIAYAKSTDSSGTFSTIATAGTERATLSPVSTADVSNWYHAAAALSTASGAKSGSYEKLEIVEGNNLGKVGEVAYYMVQNFNIRSTSDVALAKGLHVGSVEVTRPTATAEQKAMSEALRVAVKFGDVVKFYDPVANDQTSYGVWNGTDLTTTNVTCINKSASTLIAPTDDTPIPAKGTGTNGGVDVQVYVFFEGEDAKLFSEGFGAEEMTVTVNFTATV